MLLAFLKRKEKSFKRKLSTLYFFGKIHIFIAKDVFKLKSVHYSEVMVQEICSLLHTMLSFMLEFVYTENECFKC